MAGGAEITVAGLQKDRPDFDWTVPKQGGIRRFGPDHTRRKRQKGACQEVSAMCRPSGGRDGSLLPLVIRGMPTAAEAILAR